MILSRAYIDSCGFIDAIKHDLKENVGLTSEQISDIWYIQQILKAAEAGAIQVVTSTLTIAECRRTSSDKSPNTEVRRVINSVLTSGRIVTLSQVTQAIAERARDLEWVNGINLKGADAIHIASAIATGCKEFFTTDVNGSRSPLKNASRIANFGLTSNAPCKHKFTTSRISATFSFKRYRSLIQIT